MKGKWVWMVVGGLVAVAAVAFWGWRYVNAPFSGEPTWVFVESDMSREALRSELDSLGSWGSKVFGIYDHVAEKDAVPNGAYLIQPGEKARDFARRLVQRRQNPVKVTFNNIRTLSELAARIDAQLELSAGDFLAACDSILPAAGFKKPEFIAAFLPDTYEFYWTATPTLTVNRLLEYRNRFWSDERREEAKKLGLTPVKVATIASIAEEETNNRAERGVVARLYLNRYNKGMLLQADPTVKFAVGDFSLRRILGKHLKVDSPYNTYKYAGLPPGPIRMPEKATMEALLSSKPHNYLYMCAKADFSGTHNFAADFNQHKLNAAAYKKALDKIGVKGQ